MITDGSLIDDDFDRASGRVISLVEAAVDEGVAYVQLREKRLSGRNLFSLARMSAEITRSSSTRLLINDRVDVAVGAGADGVHLTETSVAADVIRKSFGNEILIICSVHSAESAADAASGGADLVVYGPVFETPGKGPAVGLDGLAQVCAAVSPFPVIGLGGIDAGNCRSVIEAGASGVAAIRGLSSRELINSMMEGLR